MPAMGRYPNTAGLGLAAAGVALVERANTLQVEQHTHTRSLVLTYTTGVCVPTR
jgi:pyruvate/2-oxoglutarate dehydrogenase complex dihydrolipoamide dehydrogenase (E3) component